MAREPYAVKTQESDKRVRWLVELAVGHCSSTLGSMLQASVGAAHMQRYLRRLHNSSKLALRSASVGILYATHREIDMLKYS